MPSSALISFFLLAGGGGGGRLGSFINPFKHNKGHPFESDASGQPSKEPNVHQSRNLPQII